jgi:hypothetical protein
MSDLDCSDLDSDRPTREASPRALFVGSILSALLFGAFIAQGLFGSLDQHHCLGHVRQLALAARMYASDYSSHFPPSDRWPSALEPYLAGPRPDDDWTSVLTCPSDKRPDRQTCRGLATSYTMSAGCSGLDDHQPGLNKVALFFDGTALEGRRESVAARHIARNRRGEVDKTCVGFADGHTTVTYGEWWDFGIYFSPPPAGGQDAP